MGDFQYNAQPHPAPIPSSTKGGKAKFRESELDPSTNGVIMSGLMADPRVMKGNTYAGKPKSKPGPAGTVTATAVSMAKTGWPGKKTIRKWNESRASTPPPPEGRISTQLQTEEYIEVLYTHSGTVQASQTYTFFDKPDEPLFNPVRCHPLCLPGNKNPAMRVLKVCILLRQ